MRFIFCLILTAVLAFGADATLEVVKKADTLPSIAVEDGSKGYPEEMSRRFFRMLVGDLNVLTIFNVERDYVQSVYEGTEVEAANKNLDYVLRFRLRQDDMGSLIVDMKMIRDAAALIEKSYRIKSENQYVFLAHTIAHDINGIMGADPVDWIKEKVILSRLSAPHKSEIIITDYTLTYQHVIIRGGLNVFPQWANKEKTAFYYTSLSEDKPTLYRMDIRTGRAENILKSDGMLVCSDVRSDGKKLLLTMAPSGQPDIYLYDVDSGRYQRVTSYRGIDVNGQFMGEGRIAFVSNRLGYPNIFSKELGASGVEQMVYYGKSNSACTAHNEYIVYKARESNNAFSRNTFNLHLISTKTNFIRRLTATGINEFPRFSHDGDAILFIKNYRQQSSIGVIRLKQNKNYLFPLGSGKIQSIDW
jgi:TolB protein